MNLQDIDCGIAKWMGLAQDHVQWQALLLVVLHLQVLLPQQQFV
jgi:hypothetical protein